MEKTEVYEIEMGNADKKIGLFAGKRDVLQDINFTFCFFISVIAGMCMRPVPLIILKKGSGRSLRKRLLKKRLQICL